MRLLSLTVLGIALLASAPTATAQSDSVLEDPTFKATAQRGLDLLYNMQFRQADAVFSALAARHPDHPVGPFLQALVPWWQILMDLSDDSHDKVFMDAMSEVISRSDRMLRRDRNNVDARFFKGAALGFRGRHRANRRSFFLAARDGFRAMDYVISVGRDYPNNADFAFGRGIYDYYAAATPERYSWTRPFMGLFPSGDKSRGLAALHRTFRDGTYLQAEAAYFLLQIYYLFEPDYDKSQQFMAFLRERYPDNAFFHTMEGRVHWRFGNWDRTDEVFRTVMRRYGQGQTGYNDAAAEQALFYLARVEERRGEYDAALALLTRLQRIGATRDEPSPFVILGRLRHGMIHDVRGERELALRRYREVLAMPEFGNSHETARRYVERRFGEHIGAN